MWQKFFLILLTTIFAGKFINAKSVKRQEVKDTSLPFRPYDFLPIDYAYGIQPRRAPYQRLQQKSNPPTTNRPLMSYWQNIMRNVRFPLPSLTWNVTNPLANLFHVENNEQIIESYPIEDEYSLSSQRQNKEKRRRKHPHNKRHKKRKPSMENQQISETQQVTQYPTNQIDENEPMYFYDPNTDAYYSIQRLNTLGANNYDPKHAMLEKQEEDDDNEEEENNDEENPVEINKTNQNVDEVDDVESDEAIEIDFDQEDQNSQQKQQLEKTKNTKLNEETLRNVLGTYMLDDYYNHQRQRTQESRKELHNVNQHSRDYLKYFYLLAMY